MIQRLSIILIACCVIVAIIAQSPPPTVTYANQQGMCADAIRMIEQSITPYDGDNRERISGDMLETGVRQVEFPAERYMDVWGLMVTRTDPTKPTAIQINFPAIDEGLALEFAFYDGMQTLIPYQPVTPNTSQQITVNRDGIMALIVRRANIYDDQAGNYQIDAQFEVDSIPIQNNLRDQTLNALQARPPFIIGGIHEVQVNATLFRTHSRGITSVGTHQGNLSQVFFDATNSFIVGRWAETVHLLGGDLVVRGNNNGRERLLFVQNYNHNISQLDGEVANVTDGNGTQWRIDWGIVDAVWIGTDCAVFKLSDGRIFASDFSPTLPRVLHINGNYQDFRVRVNNAELTLSWDGIINPITTWYDDTFQTTYEHDRQLSATDSRLDVRYQPDSAISTLQLHTRNTRIISDWQDIQALRFDREQITIGFNDGIRTQTERPADGLSLFEALSGVIRLDYNPTPDNPIDEIMLLPASDSLIEIITPAHSPHFDGRALPNQAGYQARALNNTGAECYPINSLIDSAQCPPNGHLNPANGNLFYAVTDLIAYGSLDLNLTRSYNSQTHQIDGIFGKGWSTPFRLDYQVAYDDVRNSRPITPDNVSAFPVGLDLTYAPQGIVTFYTPSGSRHTFTGTAPFLNGTMTAITQPHWTLTRPDYRAGWTLTQPDGMTYQFDRAGRLKQYGYSNQYPITLHYSGDYLNGATDLEEAIIIDDPSNQRHLELQFNGHRVAEARLIGKDKQTQTTRYIYQNDLLTEVYYHDEGVAYYSYDDEGRLTHFNDPRAPISREMFAEYGDDGAVTWYLPEQGVWQALSTPIINEERISRTLTDYTTYPQTFTYAYHAGSLRTGADNFTLLAQTTRITHPDDLEAQPITYAWTNGFLSASLNRFLSENVGRNTLSYEYNTAGYLTRIRGAHPNLAITYDPNNATLPRQIDYADQTREQFTYDESGQLTRYTDRNGAIYQLAYDENGHLIEVADVLSGTRAIYTYHEQGLIASSIPSALIDQDPPEAITYDYDSFGNLTAIHDPLLGQTLIDYTYHADGVTVTLTDALGAITISDLDHQSRLTRQTIRYQDAILRDTVYDYDAIGRLTAETRMIDEALHARTTYDYQPIAELPPFGADSQPTSINGTQVTITDPAGRITQIVYDGRERLRLYSEPLGYVERYDYRPANDPNTLPNGLIIHERKAFNRQVFDEREYHFDLAWQLRQVQIIGKRQWSLSTNGEFLPSSITPTPRQLFNSIQWTGYQAGQADAVRINQAANNPNTPNTTLSQTRDHHGQPTTLTINDLTYAVAYCPQADGGTKTVYGYDGLDCQADGVYHTLRDGAGRLIAVKDDTGTRTYDYQIVDGAWQITVNFGDAGTWDMSVNAVGDITQWIDHDGVKRDYQYDGLSRLVRLETSAPDLLKEASFTFTYNLLDQVTLSIDDVGYGLRYDYDPLGRLIVAQNTRNANATIYGYNTDGLLASIISPLGNTTTILYEDADPRRVTGVVTPTGANLRFAWNDGDNTLTFTDPRNQSTQYSFDGYGTLWQVKDALARLHHIRYNASGRLSSWRVADSYQLDFAYPAPDQWQITAPDTEFKRAFTILNGAQLGQIQMGDGYHLALGYDALGRLAGLSDGDGRTWALEWTMGSVDFVQPDGQTQTLTYDALHRLLTDEGQTIGYDAPRTGEIQTTLTPINASSIVITSSEGDAITRPATTQVRTTGTLTTITRTPEGLLDEILFEGCMDEAILSENGLDACLRGEQVWRLSERVTYDPEGRPIRIVDADQNVETFAYDEAGNLTVYQDSDGQSFNYTYDTLNRLASITSPTGIRILFDYNARDQVTAICRGRAENAQTFADCASDDSRYRARYTYDALGRLIGYRNDPSQISYAYHPEHGQLATVTLSDQQQLTFTYDALGLPQSMQVDERQIDLTLLPTATRFNLTELNGDAIVYDALNRPIQLTMDGMTLSIHYSETGYTLQLENGQSLALSLDSRQQLTAVMADDEHGATFDTFLSPDGRIQLTDTLRTDGQLIQTQGDRLGQVQNNSYFDSELLIDNRLTAGGLLQRQSIIGAARYFLDGMQDYIVVYGYDNDSRPITMRISDRQSGQRIYLLTFTYDTIGRRQTETRQFRDDTQITITYRYNNQHQLIERIRQSGREVSPITTTYHYDERGNLSTITDNHQTCRTYHYDSANRLIAVETGDQTHTLQYDALNRPAQLGDKRLIYLGTTEQVIAVAQDGAVTWHIDGLMQASGDQVIWMTHDGRGTVVNTNSETGISDLWLFDPLKRLIGLTTPEPVTCSETDLPEALTALNPLINNVDGMIWDMEAGVYLAMDGRAYLPELGTHLQQSADSKTHLFNTAYNEAVFGDSLPILPSDTAYLEGLQTFDQLLTPHTPLTAEMVLRQHLPNLPQNHFDGDMIEAIAQASQSQQTVMLEWLNLPAHIHQRYNLPTATRDAHGMLRLPTMNAPAHHQTTVMPLGTVFADREGDILPTLAPTHQTITARAPQAGQMIRPLRFYHSTLWTPTRPNGQVMIEPPRTPRPIIRPSMIAEWLPEPLQNVAQMGDLLETLVEMNSLSQVTLGDWFMEALRVHLPIPVTLPPDNLGAWREGYFNSDGGIDSWDEWGDLIDILPATVGAVFHP